MTTTLTLDKAGRVVLPKALRDELGLAAGDTLELESRGEGRLLCGRYGVPRPYKKNAGFGSTARAGL